MTKRHLPLIAILLLLCTISAKAASLSFFPGLDELIEKADAIVILRIDRQLKPYDHMNQLGNYDCLILQTLKGDIPAGKNIELQLTDTRPVQYEPYGRFSTHLIFLSGRRSLSIMGANIQLSHFGREQVTGKGDTVHDRIISLLKSTQEYNRQQLQKEHKFLDIMISGKPDTEALARFSEAVKASTNQLPPTPSTPGK